MASRKILGVDPGSRNTGYAILLEEGRSYRALECDTIRMSGDEDQVSRLRKIYRELTTIISRHQPDFCAVESPVYGVDPLAMLKLGRAQAAAMLAIGNCDLPVSEYYPKAVKKAVTGNGNAGKEQVAYMLEKLVILPEGRRTADATDALAVAWCHLTSIDRFGQVPPAKTYHQNNRKSDWKSFIENNPGRVKG